jgi:hypothetical protein
MEDHKDCSLWLYFFLAIDWGLKVAYGGVELGLFFFFVSVGKDVLINARFQ